MASGGRSVGSSRHTGTVRYIYDLPFVVLRDLCRVIDTNNLWEELGGVYMGFDITTLHEFRRAGYQGMHGSSPTHVMFTRWGQKGGSIDLLFVFLAKMELVQAMRIMEPYVSDKVRHLLRDESSGCTTYLANMMPRHHGRSPRESNEGSSISSTPKASLLNEDVSYQKVTHGYDDNHSAAKYGNKPFSKPADQTNHWQDPRRQQYQGRMPVEATDLPNSGGTLDGSFQNRLMGSNNNNNLDFYRKDDVKPAKMASTAPLSDDNNEKILNVPKNVGEILNRVTSISEVPTTPVVDSYEQQPHQAPQPGGLDFRLGPRKNSDPRTNEESYVASIGPMSSLPVCSYKELAVATNQFTSQVLGRGGFGTVFRGCWRNTSVAIKQIKKNDNPGLTTLEEAKFKQSLVELKISECRHDNILALYSYALNDDGLCLVYQLMTNGSLEDRLLCRDHTEPLPWLRRCRIVRGAACGLQFLHTLERPFIHGDIKSANILLDNSFEPKLGDFGLLREGQLNDATIVLSGKYVNGTKPYLPPEYLRNGRLSTKVDTFSFGVVLFEVATGLRAFDKTRSNKHRNLVDFVRDISSDKVARLKDAKGGQKNSELFGVFMAIGSKCTEEEKNQRPEMVDVFHSFDNYWQFHEVKNKGEKEMSPWDIQVAHDAEAQQRQQHQQRRCNEYVQTPGRYVPPGHANNQVVDEVRNPIEQTQPVPTTTPPSSLESLPAREGGAKGYASAASPDNNNFTPPPQYEVVMAERSEFQVENDATTPASGDVNADYLPIGTLFGNKPVSGNKIDIQCPASVAYPPDFHSLCSGVSNAAAAAAPAAAPVLAAPPPNYRANFELGAVAGPPEGNAADDESAFFEKDLSASGRDLKDFLGDAGAALERCHIRH